MAKEYLLTVMFRDYSNNLDDELCNEVGMEICDVIHRKYPSSTLQESLVSVSGKYSIVSNRLAARNDCFTILRHELKLAGFVDDSNSNVLKFALLLDLVQNYRVRQSFSSLCNTQLMSTDEVENDLSYIVSWLNLDKSIITRINEQFPNSIECTPKRFTAYRLIKFICEWANISLRADEGK